MSQEITIKTAVVTGPTGALGTALIQRLIQQKIKVFAVVHRGSQRIKNICSSPYVHVVECNLNEMSTLSALIPSEIDAFFHLAWDGTFGDKRNDLDLQLSNVAATVEAVKQAKSMGCKVFLGVGSQAEFGPKEKMIHFDDVCNPNTGYGAAKLEACLMSRILCQRLSMKYVWCRVFSAFGPNDGSNSLVMSEILALLHSNQMDFTKGEQVWNYIYSKDAAKAFLLAAEKGNNGSIYCVGSRNSDLLKNYILQIKDLVNPKAKINFGAKPYYPNQVMHLEPDISNLVKDTGFQTDYTFKQGIEELVALVKKEEAS